MSKKTTYILGVNLSHDGSACLLKDGQIVVAIEKERLTRIKHDGGNDKLAVEYCLQAEGISINNIDLVVQNANFEKETLKTDSYAGQRAFPLTYKVPIISISHHLAHAYSAIGTCPFDTCNVMVIDGSGSPHTQCDDLKGADIPNINEVQSQPQNFWCEKLSLYHYDKQLIPIYKDFSPFRHTQPQKPLQMPTIIHSIGGVYQAVSQYCFGNVDDTGKLMGLAPYGEKNAYTQPIFELKDGRVFNTFDWMDGLTLPSHSYQNFKDNFQYYANIARWVQDETERALLYIFNHHQKKYPNKNWCYAGGVALNAVANQRLLAETDIEQLYIQPAAGDNGIAIGCAYYGWLEVLKREKVPHNGKTNFGKTYTINTSLATTEPTLNIKTTETWIDEAAQHLANGKVIGWFVGGSEFGPRALGYRSILAHPEIEGMRDYINCEIKNREDFRPFAPAVLREDVTQYFLHDWDTPYMIQVNPVKPEWRERLKNVVHLNDTARVQTVTAQNNLHFYTLLQKFKQITGLSLLLNTSFNNRGMPIVETPQKAIDFFKNSPLDILVLENTIITKANATTTL